MHWTQAAIEFAAKKMGADQNMAHTLSAIAMAEAMPIGKFITNSTGTYTGAWAFQQAWAARQYDWNRLSNDLDYDAVAAINLWRAPPAGPTHMKWETWPGAAAKFMAAGGLVRAYDTGGYLPPGLSMAYNGTGRPEPVGGGVQNNSVTLTIHVANGDPVTIQETAQRVVDDALSALARKLSSGAGRN